MNNNKTDNKMNNNNNIHVKCNKGIGNRNKFISDSWNDSKDLMTKNYVMNCNSKNNHHETIITDTTYR